MTGRNLFFIVYGVIVLLPFFIVMSDGADLTSLYTTGKILGLTGTVILFIQLILVGRFVTFTKLAGARTLIRFHKKISTVAAVMLAAHPVLLSAGSGSFYLLTTFQLPWPVLIGKAALLLIILQVLSSLYQKQMKLKYPVWRLLHDFLALMIVLAASVHSMKIGDDFTSGFLRIYWISGIVFFYGMFIYHRWLRSLIK